MSEERKFLDEYGRAITMVGKAWVLCHVPRWTIVPHRRPQSVAEHSFMVAMIAHKLASSWTKVPAIDPDEVAVMALRHDIDEAHTGDIPSPCKGDPSKIFITLEKAIVKLADLIETHCYIGMYGNTAPRTYMIEDALHERLTEHMAGMERKWPNDWLKQVSEIREELYQ